MPKDAIPFWQCLCTLIKLFQLATLFLNLHLSVKAKFDIGVWWCMIKHWLSNIYSFPCCFIICLCCSTRKFIEMCHSRQEPGAGGGHQDWHVLIIWVHVECIWARMLFWGFQNRWCNWGHDRWRDVSKVPYLYRGRIKTQICLLTTSEMFYVLVSLLPFYWRWVVLGNIRRPPFIMSLGSRTVAVKSEVPSR